MAATRSTDQVARDTANKAIALIASHEQLCGERQGHIIENIKEVKDAQAAAVVSVIEYQKEARAAVAGIYTRLWIVGGGFITTLLASCGALIYALYDIVSRGTFIAH